MSKIVIIGAGITGLSCAYFLKKPYIILEKEARPGGLCRSVNCDGFTFDYSGHFFHVRNKEIESLVTGLLKNNISKIKRNAFIFSNNRFIPYPFQANLYHLPEKIRKECLEGFLKKLEKSNAKAVDSFYSWSLATFGKGITKHFMKPYNEKLWTVPAHELTADWVAPFVPQPTMEEVQRGAANKKNRDFGYNAYFYYPRSGGCQAFIDSLLPKVKNIQLGTGSQKINTAKKYIETSDNQNIPYEKIISTMPLSELVSQLDNLPEEIEKLSKKLKCNSVTCLNIGIKKKFANKKNLAKKHWVYFPEKEYEFYRAGIYSNIMPSSAPKDSDSFYVEVSYGRDKKADKQVMLSKTIQGLIDSKLINSDNDIEVVNWMDMPYAYVIYDKDRQKTVKKILKYLSSKDIYSIGRYGAWKYSFMEESILDAKKLVSEI